MCRSIKKLRRVNEPPTEQELHGAALQFVRKISGYNSPSQANRTAFDSAVSEVADASRRLFTALEANSRGVAARGKE